MAAQILLLDSYDSFTYNLVMAFRSMGALVDVVRNDAISVEAALARRPSHLVLSPGPGRPEEAGILMALTAAAIGRLPILGVCLGHEAIGMHLGGRLVRARALVHGKASPIHHDGQGLFAGLPNPTPMGRYHSLALDAASLPPTLIATAHSEDGELMGLRHRALPVFGVQFHPESILSPCGEALLANFLAVEGAPGGLHPEGGPQRRPGSATAA